MQKALELILEYERARREVSKLNKQIRSSIYDEHYTLKCLRPVFTKGNTRAPCITALWEHNLKEREEHWPRPTLCKSCQLTQILINKRTAAKRLFGIAKMRISRNAAEYLKSAGKK
jgi:hypothetical protein